MEVYVLINTDSGMVYAVAEAMLRTKGVKAAHAVTGQFDVVAFAEFEDMATFGEAIHLMQKIKGVRKTQSLMTIPWSLVEEPRRTITK